MQEVENDINKMINKVIPQNCSNSPIPYMTDGDYVGQKCIMYEDD